MATAEWVQEPRKCPLRVSNRRSCIYEKCLKLFANRPTYTVAVRSAPLASALRASGEPARQTDHDHQRNFPVRRPRLRRVHLGFAPAGVLQGVHRPLAGRAGCRILPRQGRGVRQCAGGFEGGPRRCRGAEAGRGDRPRQAGTGGAATGGG